MDYEILSSIDLNYALQKYNIFKGTYAANTVPLNNLKETQAFIVNTQTNDKQGEHWTVLIVNKSKCIFFDSFGFELLNLSILESLKNLGVKFYKYNTRPVQPLFSENCGYYCIAFILSYINNMEFSDFMNNFSSNKLLNNSICYKFIQKYI